MKTIQIAKDVDSIVCSQQAVGFAESLGFQDAALWELAIAVSELATNVLKFARHGTLTLRALEEPAGIEVVVEDDGPGIEDLDSAMVDGFSEGHLLWEEVVPMTRRGLGAGLGAVQRLMNSLVVENTDGGGTKVTACKWLPARNEPRSK